MIAAGRRSIAVAALTAALLAAGATALAQQHEGSGESAGESHAAPSDHGAAEHGATEHEGGTHAEHAHHPPPIRWTWWQSYPQLRDAEGRSLPPPVPVLAHVINFGLVVGLLFFAVRRSINPALATRRGAIEAELGEAQRLRAEAEAMHREYTERLARLDDELAAMRAEFVSAGERERERIVSEARVRAERMHAEGKLVIQQEIAQLRSDLIREAVEAAVTSAEQAVSKAANPSDQARLADDYLAHLEKTSASGGVG